jgi:hypothetical protein
MTHTQSFGQTRSGRAHLVVELKASKVGIGSAEATQIKEYAYAVASDSQFRARTSGGISG